ncbi:hypothetical protein FPV67DRAFT_884264 [Lyophyllum atratum]|nr:hypothetical protein FPV67DRAFT_884264 [Lyophyllum atratum]
MRLGSYSSACTAAFVLSLLPGGLSVDLPVKNTSVVLTTRATPAGSCISAPDDSCTTLTGICIGKVLNGQVAANNLWSSPECFSAAFCTGVGPILDALCCAGSCEQPSSINSIDYTKIYAAIVGNCAFAAGGCSLTWTPFVNWFYNTIQATGTNSWPQDGDSVLDWWSKVATWTNFCTGDLCVDGAIPYVNLNDWTHFSGAPIVTTPGTPGTNDPQYLFGDIEDDVWIVTQNDPCPSDNATDCSYDHGPPSKVVNGQVVPDGPGQFARSIDTETASFQSKRKRALGSFGPAILGLEGFTSSSHRPLTSIGPQGKNCPPPVFIDDGRVPVPLNITGCEQLAIVSTLNKSVPSSVSLTRPGDVTPLNLTMPPFNDLATLITPDQCQGSTDTPVPLPILTYYCDRLPFICANIRATGLLSNDQMILTYDPFNGKTRRNGVCGLAVREAMQQAGKCDKRQHNPDYWLMSCDEFPFNMVLEGGAGNAQVRAVPTREQQYQGSLNAMISQLIRLNGDKTTKWAGPTGKMCHAFILHLSDTRPAGLVVKAVGQLARGGAFWADRTNITPTRIITDSRASTPAPARYPADIAYISKFTDFWPAFSW